MPQNEHIELFQKRYGKRLDHEEKTRKKEARSVHKKAEYAQKVRGKKRPSSNTPHADHLTTWFIKYAGRQAEGGLRHAWTSIPDLCTPRHTTRALINPQTTNRVVAVSFLLLPFLFPANSAAFEFFLCVCVCVLLPSASTCIRGYSLLLSRFLFE